MSFSRAFQWYHSLLDPIWPDGTFKYRLHWYHLHPGLSDVNNKIAYGTMPYERSLAAAAVCTLVPVDTSVNICLNISFHATHSLTKFLYISQKDCIHLPGTEGQHRQLEAEHPLISFMKAIYSIISLHLTHNKWAWYRGEIPTNPFNLSAFRNPEFPINRLKYVETSARIYRPSFRENKPKTLVLGLFSWKLGL